MDTLQLAYDAYGKLVNAMGAEQFLLDLVAALSADELLENCRYIARVNDIEL